MAILGKRGFTFVECLVAPAIVSLLAFLAIPSYTCVFVKGRRADGRAALLDLAARLEHYYAENNTYATARIGTGADVDRVLDSAITPDGFYRLSFLTQTPTEYTLQATPLGRQAMDDSVCATLTYTSRGQKGQTGNGATQDCWP